MSIPVIVTFAFILIAAISAVATLFVREVFHAAILLLVCLLCIAGIFITFNSEFLAVVQIIIYAGGTLLLIIFGVMLTARSNDPGNWNTGQNEILSAVIGLALFSILIYSLDGSPTPSGSTSDLSPMEIGKALMTSHTLAFELSGVLLLVCLLGAIAAATQGKINQRP